MMWRIVKIVLVVASASGLISGAAYGQTQAQAQAQTPSQAMPQQKQDSDRPAPTCAKILQMTSSEWIANVTAIHDSSEDGHLRGIRIYGDCYDARTKRLAAALGKSGKGPLMGARDDFKDFETAIKDFEEKALAANDPPADAVKTAYASLYEKQFRYAFYQSYEPQIVSASDAANKTSPHTNAAPAARAPKTPALSAPDAPSKTAPSDADDMTRAKNRFGELLEALPDDKLHELHAAFGTILGLHPTSSATKLAVYHYAIFLLEPFTSQNSLNSKPLAKPFSSPPF
jgi:hypothetical protein